MPPTSQQQFISPAAPPPTSQQTFPPSHPSVPPPSQAAAPTAFPQSQPPFSSAAPPASQPVFMSGPPPPAQGSFPASGPPPASQPGAFPPSGPPGASLPSGHYTGQMPPPPSQPSPYHSGPPPSSPHMPPTSMAQSNHLPPGPQGAPGLSGPLQPPPGQPGVPGGFSPQQNGEQSDIRSSSCLELLPSSLISVFAGAFGQVRGPQPGYAGPYPGQPNYGAPAPAPAPAPPAQKRLDPDAIPSPVNTNLFLPVNIRQPHYVRAEPCPSLC